MDAIVPKDSGGMGIRFVDDSLEPPVCGFLDRPPVPQADRVLHAKDRERAALVLTHGAGSNCEAPLLVAVSRAFSEAGFTVLRCDLPFRQQHRHGPPLGTSATDREGLRNAVSALRKISPGSGRRIFLGGHSYGGRQASMVAASDHALVDGLLLLSYPLHPPRRPAELRTAHFPELRTPAFFVHGSRDAFGSLEELEQALGLIPAAHSLLPVEGAAHDLGFNRSRGRAATGLPGAVVAAFQALMETAGVKETLR